VLILNKKSISNQDNQIFKTELEKFRPHQNRILQANHKQNSLLKELTRSYDALLQDKRVRAEHSKFEAFSRQRNTALQKYRRVYQAFNDLVTGLERAQGFYSEMKETVESLHKNVETFVNNRRSEGGQLLGSIEAAKQANQNGGLVDWERERLKELMDRMSVNPSSSPSSNSPSRAKAPTSTGPGGPPPRPPYSGPASPPIINQYATAAPPSSSMYGQSTATSSLPTGYLPRPTNGPIASPPPTGQQDFTYNPTSWGPVSPPPNTGAMQQQQPGQQYFNPPPHQSHSSSGGQPNYSNAHSNPSNFQQQQYQPQATQRQHQSAGSQQLPPGWQPPPPPPGPPPSQQDYNFGLQGGEQRYPAGPGGYAAPAPRTQPQQGQRPQDPFDGLSGWR
jgi:hypothetical protein